VDGKGYVSISHSGNLVAVALHDECDIGIDVELRSSRISAVRGRVLSPAEEMALDSSNEEEALLLHWSAKESFYKIVGNRGGSYAENFAISPFTVGASGCFYISYIDKGNLIKKLPVNYFVASDYVFTLCVDDEQ
jgi:phosphopantetheinyl transferase